MTVNGHVVGEWIPVRHQRYLTVQEAKAALLDVRRDAEQVMAERFDENAVDYRTPEQVTAAYREVIRAEAGFNTRPFTPVPKKGK